MGPLRYQSPGPGPGCLILVLILLRISYTEQGRGCKFDHCDRQYQDSMDMYQIAQSANLQHCQVLSAYSECLRQSSRGCRGNIRYHTRSTYVTAWNKEYNCSYVLSHSHLYQEENMLHTPVPTESSICNLEMEEPDMEYVHCGLFGDPHIRTFTGKFYTCKVLGAWPVVANDHLLVQATNEAVAGGSSATVTATTKLTVIVMEHPACAEEKYYQAEVDSLPLAFVDGSQGSGPDGSLYLEQVVPGEHVVIYARFIGTTVIIRQIGRYLTLAVKMPQKLMRTSHEGLELCSAGCPPSQRINHQYFLSNPDQLASEVVQEDVLNMSVDEAILKCRRHNVTDYFFDSCVFDLITTGDTDFVEAARSAMTDVWSLSPELMENMPNRTILNSAASILTKIKMYRLILQTLLAIFALLVSR